jgi:tRNA nucleotidyltransferase/poly(A) polymerase
LTVKIDTEAGIGMPDYIYLLENRLSADQQSALRHLREVAYDAGTILFLTGDAVRDLTSGHAVRDLEVAVHGSALKLKKAIEKRGGKVWGEDEATRALFLCFPGTVRVDLVSAHRVELPKPGKPVYHPASILEDLRRRDFTVNAMAISLNEGSYGLLMDPMNGSADIESRCLRLVSNYGFLEEPSLLIRATRYMARLGWEMDPKTQTRYDNARQEGVIEYLTAQARRRELEQIGHEEEGLKVLRALQAEGWMKILFPAWTPDKADEQSLTALHDLAVELLMQGVQADISAAQMRLLTAKLSGRELASLKKQMLRPGFVEEWNSLDTLAAGFAKVLLSRENSVPSACFKLFTSYDPEAVLWLGFTSKDATVKERFNLFLKVWPELRKQIPHALMQEMRITAELPAYHEIVHSIFLQLIDGKLTTPEEARVFLEPYSPPPPPPKEVIKRPRVKRGTEAKLKDDAFDDDEDSEGHLEEEHDLDDIGGDDDDIDLGLGLPKIDLDVDLAVDAEIADDDDESAEPQSASETRLPKPPSSPVKAEKPAAAKSEAAARPEKVQPAPKPKPESGPTPSAKPAPSKPAKAQGKKPVAPAKPVLKKLPAKPAVKPPVKAAASAKAPGKTITKASGKAASRASVPGSATAKKKSPPAASARPVKAARPAAKNSASKAAKKR